MAVVWAAKEEAWLAIGSLTTEVVPGSWFFLVVVASGVWRNPLLFTGQRFDPETGLYQYRNRYYDPQLGRFTNRDPVGYVDGPNLYEYVSGNPVLFLDPVGRNVYTIGGTNEKSEDRANTQRFWDLAREPGGYWDGTGSFFTRTNMFHDAINPVTLLGLTSKLIVNSVKRKICRDYCKNRNVTINIVGWSRGAVAALRIARELNDEGCCCGGRTVRPVPVNWLGLFDPVSMHFRPGWRGNVRPNVMHVSNATSTHTGAASKAPFPRLAISLSVFGDTSTDGYFVYNFDGSPSSHSDVGGAQSTSANDALLWMLQQASQHGVSVHIPPSLRQRDDRLITQQYRGPTGQLITR